MTISWSIFRKMGNNKNYENLGYVKAIDPTGKTQDKD